MNKKEYVWEFFKEIEGNLESIKERRDLYYAAQECLSHFDYCPEIPSGSISPYFGPFITSFFYLLRKSRLELAGRIYMDGIRDMNPDDMIDYHYQLVSSIRDIGDWYEYLMSMDQLISFLAHLGYETCIEKLADGDTFINSSWVKLFKRFLKCNNPPACHTLLLDVYNICEDFAGGIGDVDDIKTFNFRKWLLKRQLLGIYAAVRADCFYRGYFQPPGEQPEILGKIGKLLGDIYQNYIFLICYSLDSYVSVALETLEKIQEIKEFKGLNVWYEDLPGNLIHQAAKIDRRYSDVKDLIELTTGITISSKWAEDIAGRIKKNKPSENSLGNLIDWLREAREHLRKENQLALKEENINPIIEEIKKRVLSRGRESFWERCRKKFLPGRVRLLVASLDNKYSTESAYMFKSPVVKLDRDEPIPTELFVLKKWGSTASIFEEDKDYNSSFGGGFYLTHNGFGVCIDPGPDFLRNLTRYTDFDLMDINAVVCTHTHYDHFADFKRILLGIREYNREVGYKRLYYYFPDPDDQEMHPEKWREDFCINVFEKPGANPAGSDGDKYYYIPNNAWGLQEGIRIRSIKVIHEISRSRSWSYGLLVEPLNNGKPVTSILFSGDAEYEAGLFSDYDPELLVLNCASVRLKDITAVTPNDASRLPAEKRAKKNQLGYSGSLSLLYKMGKYKLALLSDFFEAQGEVDTRLFITEALKKDMQGAGKPGKLILAAEPGMRIRWDTSTRKNGLEVYCSLKCALNNSGFVGLKNPGKIDQFKNFTFPRKEPIIISCADQCKERKKIVFFR